MSRWLALATEPEIETQTPPDSMTKPDKTPSTQPERGFCQVLSNCQVDPQEKTDEAKAPDFRHGQNHLRLAENMDRQDCLAR